MGHTFMLSAATAPLPDGVADPGDHMLLYMFGMLVSKHDGSAAVVLHDTMLGDVSWGGQNDAAGNIYSQELQQFFASAPGHTISWTSLADKPDSLFMTVTNTVHSHTTSGGSTEAP